MCARIGGPGPGPGGTQPRPRSSGPAVRVPDPAIHRVRRADPTARSPGPATRVPDHDPRNARHAVGRVDLATAHGLLAGTVPDIALETDTDSGEVTSKVMSAVTSAVTSAVMSPRQEATERCTPGDDLPMVDSPAVAVGHDHVVVDDASAGPVGHDPDAFRPGVYPAVTVLGENQVRDVVADRVGVADSERRRPDDVHA